MAHLAGTSVLLSSDETRMTFYETRILGRKPTFFDNQCGGEQNAK
jgi:hypothetical protein